MNNTGDKGVENNLDCFMCRPGTLWNRNIPCCHLHGSQVIYYIKNDCRTLAK